MTRRDLVHKWAVYALALLPVWWLDQYVLNRFLVLGVSPRLLPVAAVTVAVVEGAAGRPVARPNLHLCLVAPANPAQLRQTMLYLNYVRH